MCYVCGACMCVVLQRIGVYNQHAADQLEMSESSVEYLRVSDGCAGYYRVEYLYRCVVAKATMLRQAGGLNPYIMVVLELLNSWVGRIFRDGKYSVLCSESSTQTTSSLARLLAAMDYQATPMSSRLRISQAGRRPGLCLLSWR